MKLLTNMLILTLTAMTLLGACSENKHRASNEGTNKLGTGDSGGGNLYKGRPIESYAADITTLPAFKNRLAPVLSALSEQKQDILNQTTHPMLALLFKNLIKNKTWYLIPGPLETLPKEKTGIAVATEQGALQSNKEVWIDSTLYAAMNEEDQATLLLHEILMGLRILQFESWYDQCMTFSHKPEPCIEADRKPKGDISQLDARKDYPFIRAAVLEILKTYNQNNYDDWSDLMARYNFLPGTGVFDLKASTGEVSADEFLRNLKRSTIANQLPTFGYRENHIVGPRVTSSESCSVSFSKNQDGTLRVTLVAGASEKREFNLHLPPQLKYYVTDFYQSKYRTFKLSEPLPGLIEGQKFMSADLMFSYETLAGVVVKETITTEVTATGGRRDYLKDGFSYTCSDQKVLESP